MNVFEKAIAAVSPSAGLRRARNRMALQAITARYDAATSGSRAPRGRNVRSDANGAAVHRAIIANVARDLARNSPFGVRVPQVITNNVVGDGIIPKVMGLSAKGQKRKRDKLMAAVRAHFDTTACDADGMLNLYGLQRLACDTLVTSGEVLIRRRRRDLSDGLPVPFQMQVMETDFLSKDNDGDLPNGHHVLNGIEFTAWGKRVAYYLYDKHPGDLSRWTKKSLQVRRVPASEIIHLFRVDRPGQMRGVSWLAPVVMVLNDLADYMDAQLLRQKIAAAFTGFVSRPESDTPPRQEDLDKRFSSIVPGRMESLAEGETVTFTDPPSVDGLEASVRTYMRAAAVGTGITYEALTGDLSQVNFTSHKAGRMEMNANVSSWQWLLMIPQMMMPISDWFMEAYRIVNPAEDIPRGVMLGWVPPRMQMVDPAREVPALIKKIRGGLASWQGTVRELGFDPEDLIEEIIADNKMLDIAEVIFDSDPRRTSGAGQGQDMPQTGNGGPNG